MWKTFVAWLSRPERVIKVLDEERLERVETRVRELKETVNDQTREIKGLRLEWEETYDKVHHQLSRIAKRSKNPSPPELEEQPIAGDAPASSNNLVGMHDRLQQARARHGLLPR